MQINSNYNPYIYPKSQTASRPCLSQPVCDTFTFKGHAQSEKIFKKGFKRLIQQTAFFREPETDMFVHDYLLKTFGQDETIKIVSGACSSGEEAVTQSMLFYPQKNKVEILGIDLGKKAIKQANSRRYVFEGLKPGHRILDYFKHVETSPFSDCYLAFEHESKGLTPQQQHFKSLFNEFFEPSEEKLKTPFMEKLQYLIEKNALGAEPLEIERRAYKLKDGMAENCRFIQGDIRDIIKLTNGEKQNAIFFKNAMYHLTAKDVEAYDRIPRKDAEAIAEDLVTKFRECLKNKGVVVFGENESGEISGTDILPKVMKKLGFRPLNKTANHPANVWQINK